MEVEEFYGVYLLVSENPKFKNRTYIGYTVDPNRRIKQHNGGILKGGAWKTSKHGPWTMVMIIHGFPNDVSALRFEWAWQHPTKSRRLKHIPKLPRTQTLKNAIIVLEEMLSTAPWRRLPLTVRWFSETHRIQFRVDKTPPLHMPITQGPVQCVKVKPTNEEATSCQKSPKCFICAEQIQWEHKLECLNMTCEAKFHILCLRKHRKSSEQNEKDFILPLIVECPKCHLELLWGEIIRLKNGCYKNLEGQAS